MYATILIPVDLEHADQLEKAMVTAGDLARAQGAQLHVVGVTAALPGAAAHNPAEFGEKLKAWAGDWAGRLGLDVASHVLVTGDPQTEMDDRILAHAHEIGADLIVMATRVPGFAERIFGSHGGRLAAQADISVFLVR